MCEPCSPTDYPQDTCIRLVSAHLKSRIGKRCPCDGCHADRTVCNGWPQETFEETD